jgi:hypothetical protein
MGLVCVAMGFPYFGQISPSLETDGDHMGPVFPRMMASFIFFSFGVFLWRAYVLYALNRHWERCVQPQVQRGSAMSEPLLASSMQVQALVLNTESSISRWERRAVDGLSYFFTAHACVCLALGASCFGLCLAYVQRGWFGKIGSGVFFMMFGIGLWIVAFALRNVAVAIADDRRRFAQTLFSGSCLTACVLYFICNAPGMFPWIFVGFPTIGNVSMSWQRGGGGLVGTVYFVRLFKSRWRADREAEAEVKEDAQEYDRIVEIIHSHDGEKLDELTALCVAANRDAAKLFGSVGQSDFNNPKQSNPADLAVLYGGGYLARLYASALTWSSEFRQVVTKLAVLSGCRLEIPSGREFDGIKMPDRTIEKVCRVYGGRCDRVLDLLRATVVADDVSQMLIVLKALRNCFDKRVSIRRIKNKFDPKCKVKGGFRNVHINLVLKHPDIPEDPGFMCELQIQHREIWQAEQSRIVVVGGVETTPHDRYIQFRNFRAE